MKEYIPFYDRLASVYDQITGVDEAWNPNKVMRPLIQPLVKPGYRVLDIGIGTGQTSELLIETGLPIDIYGIDTSSKMIEVCRAKFRQVKLFNCDIEGFVKLNLGLEFDLIVCSGMIEFIADLEHFLRLCQGLMSPNATFFFTYEPVVLFHHIQNKKKSFVIPNADKSTNKDEKDFYFYRWHPGEVHSLLKSLRLELVNEVAFVAYRQNGIDMTYHIIQCQNLCHKN